MEFRRIIFHSLRVAPDHNRGAAGWWPSCPVDPYPKGMQMSGAKCSMKNAPKLNSEKVS